MALSSSLFICDLLQQMYAMHYHLFTLVIYYRVKIYDEKRFLKFKLCCFNHPQN